MSTRANIIIKDKYIKMYFYRHSDGYPKGVMPTLEKFIKWVKKGKIRDNVGQAAGWLIVIGAIEYASIPEHSINDDGYAEYGDISSLKDPSYWKAGSYEPTDGIHGDIEHLYVIDLEKKTIEEIPSSEWEKWK